MSHSHAHAHAHADTQTPDHVEHTHPRPLRGLLPYLLSRRGTFAAVVASGILFAASTIAAAGTGAWLIGGAVTGEPMSALTPRVAWLVGLAATAVFAVWWQSEISHDWAFRLLRELRVRIFDGLERATPGRVLGKRTGDLASTAVNDVNTTEMFFAHLAGDYVGAVTVSLAALGVIAVLSPPVALVAAVLMALVAVVPFVLARRAAKEGRAIRAELGGLNAEALDGVQGLRELAVFGQGHAYRERLLRRTDRFQRHQRRYAWRSRRRARGHRAAAGGRRARHTRRHRRPGGRRGARAGTGPGRDGAGHRQPRADRGRLRHRPHPRRGPGGRRPRAGDHPVPGSCP
jgi:ATP-binding cassette subfamily C protein CydC